MNLLELQKKVNSVIESAIEYGADPADVTVSIQIELPESTEWSSDITLYYDNDGQASGCVLVGDAGDVSND